MIIGKKDNEKINKLEKDLADAKKEIVELKNKEPLKSLEFVKNAISKIRQLDLSSSNNLLYNRSWDERARGNRITEYMLLLRSELNMVYCLFSQNKLENQINNINKIIKNDEDSKEIKAKLNEIEEINKNKENTFLVNIEKDYNNDGTSITKHAYNFYNRNLNTFPNNFFYGIEEDKKF